MTDEKTGPVCAHCGKRKSAHLSLWWCSNVRSSFFTPAEPEAKEATDADFELRATCPHGFSYIEDCDRCPWSPEAKEVEPTDRAWMRAAIKTLQSDRDAAIERAEKAEADAREFGGNAYRRLEARAENAENRNVNLQRCHCGQHSMERPDIHGINWYWSKHTREACTLELPNVRCWCGRLRSEHIDGHAAPIIPPAVDPRDAADEWTDAKCDSYKTTTSSWGRYAMDAIKRRNARIAELEEKLVAADVYGVELARRIGERGARIAELETILASTRETWNEQVQELEIDRDQQRARADAAEARCGEVAREQREACSDYIAQSSDSVARHFSRVVRNTPLFTGAKERSK